MPQLPPETPWYIVVAVFALYGVWKLVQPYFSTRVRNAARKDTAETDNRIERIEIEQRRQVAQIESEKAMLSHLGNLVNKVSELAEAFVDSNKSGAQERAAWLAAIERQTSGIETLQVSVDALPGRIAEHITQRPNNKEPERE